MILLRSRLAVVAALTAAVSPAATASTYVSPSDYAITALDLETGVVLWRTQPPELRSPLIEVVGHRIVARETRLRSPDLERLERELGTGQEPADETQDLTEDGVTVFDAESGRLLPVTELTAAARVGPFPPLPTHRLAPDGSEILYRGGATKHLEAYDGSEVHRLAELEDAPYDLHVVGDLIVFSLAGPGASRRGGEVVAYSMSAGALRWQFESWRHREPPRYALTELAVDGERVYVAVDQVIFALDAASGEVAWETELPRQEIRAWDSPWTTIGRRGDRLLVACYEDLFALDADTGQLLWSFDAGPFGRPWPTLAGDRAFLATREGPVELLSWSPGGEPPRSPPYSILRVDAEPAGVRLSTVRPDEVPAGAVAWHSLSPLPAPRGESVIVELETLVDLRGESRGPRVTRLEVGGVLERERRAFVKLGQWTDRVTVRQGGSSVAELSLEPSALDPICSGLYLWPIGLAILGLLLVVVALTTTEVVLYARSTRRIREPRVAAAYRRHVWISNGVPGLLLVAVGVPVGLGALLLLARGGFSLVVTLGATLGLTVLAMLAAYCTAANRGALLGNGSIARAVRRTLGDEGHFVGVAQRPKTCFNQMLDTHDEIGLLETRDDSLHFRGARGDVSIPREAIVDLRRATIWQFAFLGARWLIVDWRDGETARELRIESREGRTVIECRRATDRLSEWVEKWWRADAPS